MTSNDPQAQSPSFFGTRQGRHILILGALTVLMVVAAIYAVSSERQATTANFEPFVFFPDLEDQAEFLREVIITSKDDGVVRMEWDGSSKWFAPEKFNFAVKVEEIRGLLIQLLETEAIEAKTARADWHEMLGLVDPAQGGAGVKVELKNADGDIFGALIVGDSVGVGAPGSDGARYVRRAGENQTYVARGDLSVKQDINDWLDRNVVDLFRERVEKVAVTPLDGAPFVLSRATASDENFALNSVPEGRELLSDTTPNQLGSALANVKFDDVRPATDFDFSKGAQLAYETFDGLRLSIAALKLGDDHWVQVSADLLPESVVPSGGESTAQPVDPSTGLKSREDVEAEAALIVSRTAGWAYRIPSWKGDALQRDLESMLKPLEDDAADSAAE